MDLRGERNSWKTQFKNARLFFSPGLEWLITQAAVQELLSAVWSHPAQHTETEIAPVLTLFWNSVNSRELRTSPPATEFQKAKCVASAVIPQSRPCHLRVPSFWSEGIIWPAHGSDPPLAGATDPESSLISWLLCGMLLDHRWNLGLKGARETLMGSGGHTGDRCLGSNQTLTIKSQNYKASAGAEL